MKAYDRSQTPGDAFQKLYDVVVRLRAPGGCPWDRKQTSASMRSSLVDESYEAVEAIDGDDPVGTAEELGDVLLVATMIAIIEEESERSVVTSLLDAVVEKLIRRHPHVFGDAEVANADEVLAQWNRIKVEEEKKRPKDRLLDSVSTALPPLERAYKLQKKAAKAGFDWGALHEVVNKLTEELEEFEHAVKAADSHEVEEELGDLLFSAINVARFAGIDPALALRRANEKFATRFAHVEEQMKASGSPLDKEHQDEMERHWQAAKELPRGGDRQH